MDTDLRIPLTSEQKAQIVEATKDEPESMAAWARSAPKCGEKEIVQRHG
jgi:hypothetical protein